MKRLIFLLSLLFSSYSFANLDQPKTQKDFAAFYDLSEAKYQLLLEKYKTHFRPIDVEVAGGTKRTYAVIFRKNTPKVSWSMKTKLSGDAYATEWTKMKDKGFRLIDQETYILGSKRFYGGIWIKDGITSWASKRNQTNEAFKATYNAWKKDFMPIDVDAYKRGSTMNYSSVWVRNTKNIPWKIKWGLTEVQYKKAFNDNKAAGYRLLTIISYKSNVHKYGAIWVKDPMKSLARRDMSATGMANYFGRYTDAGYRLADLEIYKKGTATRFSAVYVQNDLGKINYSLKSNINTKIKNYLKANPTQGLSVAVSVKGKTKFQKGYGYQNKENSKYAVGGTIYRIASVSKAVCGVLGFEMRQKGLINLDKKVRTQLSGLPAFHNYTLADTLTNRSMVRHYKKPDPVNFLGEMKNQWEAVKTFMNDNLKPGNYLYSTHAYSIFAAYLEKKTGKSICSLLNTHLSVPQGLSTLKCEVQKKSLYHRAKAYSYDPEKKKYTLIPKPRSISWKRCGGGLELNIKDMNRFGVRLHQNKIFTAQDLTDMITRPDSAKNYAYGWDIGTHLGEKVIAKSGGQTGARSYIRVYPESGVVLSFLSNTRGAGFRGLAKSIAAEIIK